MRTHILRRQLLLLALLPGAIIATILSGYHIQSRLGQLDHEIENRLQAAAIHFASVTVYPVFSGDVSTLATSGIEEILNSSPELEYATVRAANRSTLIEYGNPIISRIDSIQLPDTEGFVIHDDSLIYHRPVRISEIDPGSVLDPESQVVEPNISGWVSIQYSLKGLQSERASILISSLSITLGGLLLGAVLAMRLGDRIDRPIRHLVDILGRLGRGDLTKRASVNASGEISSLAQGINLMAGSLERSHIQLQQEVDSATSDLQQSLETVRRHEERYRGLVQNTGSLIFQFDPAGNITFVNNQALEFFGVHETDFIGQHAIGTILEPKHEEPLKRFMETTTFPTSTVVSHIGTHGERRYVNWSIQKLKDEKGQHISTLAHGFDITQRHRYQKSIAILSESETSLEMLFNMVSLAMGISLDYRWVGIAFTTPDSAEPVINYFVEMGKPIDLHRTESLQGVLAEVLGQGVPVEIVTGLPTLHIGDAQGDGIVPRTMYAIPFGEHGSHTGVLFSIDNRTHSATPAGRDIAQLCVNRLTVTLAREDVTRQLKLAHDQALASTAAKSRFLANISHEIRTPMNGIIGFTNLLLRQPLEHRQLHHVKQIRQSGQSLLNIINDLLDLSKAEAGKLSMKPQLFDPLEIIEALVGRYSSQMYAKGLEFNYRIKGKLAAEIVSDPERFRQILENLLGNALKFTAQGHIELTVESVETGPDRSEVRVAVSDTGDGISQRDQQHLFEAFSQVGDNLTVQSQGTGLGLSICRQIVTALGGKIGVDSVPGEGSTFWFTLPTPSISDAPLGLPVDISRVVLQEPDPRLREAAGTLLDRAGFEADLVADDQAVLQLLDNTAANPIDLVILAQSDGETLIDVCTHRIPSLRNHYQGRVLLLTRDPSIDCSLANCVKCANWCAQKPFLLKTLRAGYTSADELPDQGLSPGVHLPKELRVLVVDDNEINRLLVTTLLEEQGMTVHEARDGKEAVRMATSGVHDLILMDVQMPQMSGPAALDRIQTTLGDTAPPIIALTANATREARTSLIDSGFDDVIDKPINEERLWQAMTDQLRRTGSSIQNEQTDNPASSSPFDAHTALAIAGGKPELALQMVGLFCEEIPHFQAELQQQWQVKAVDELKSTLHKLGGSANYCAMRDLAAAIIACEQNIEDEGLEASASRFERVLGELERLVGCDFETDFAAKFEETGSD